jgi:WD40 repeat protein
LIKECVNSVQYSPDMSIFVSGSDDTKVNLWHASTYQISNSFVANNICVRSMIFLKFKDEFLLGGEDGSVSRWKYTFKRI